MYITTSKKADLFIKRFSKYLSKFLINTYFINRSKTPLYKILEKSKYYDYDYFLITRKLKDNRVNLLVYKKINQFYKASMLIELEVLDLRHLVSFKQIESYDKINDQENILFFLDKQYKSKKSDFSLKKIDDVYNFFYKDFYLGFKFKILNKIKLD